MSDCSPNEHTSYRGNDSETITDVKASPDTSRRSKRAFLAGTAGLIGSLFAASCGDLVAGEYPPPQNIEATVQSSVKATVAAGQSETKVIQLQRPTSVTTVPTSQPNATVARPSPVPTQARRGTRILIAQYPVSSEDRYTKVQSYFWENGENATLIRQPPEVGRHDMRQPLQSGNYAGVWAIGNIYDDADVFELAKFVKNGGRLFYEIGDCINQVFLTAMRNYFEISISCDAIKDFNIYANAGDYLSLWQGLTIGFPPPFIDKKPPFFTVRGNNYTLRYKMSVSENIPRGVIVYGTLGNGEIILLSVGHRFVYKEDKFGNLIEDNVIDQYNNKEGAIRVANWLSRKASLEN